MGRRPKDGPALCARFSCVAEMNAAAPVNVMPAAQGDGHPGGHLDEPTAGLRRERMIEHLHSLGVRALAELLDEIAAATGQPAIVADRIEAFAKLDPEVLRFLGGDRFTPNLVEVVR